ncbi:BatD family protein [Rubrivirga sp. IMCC43871]|uniref:BatD family protein n=1 Tax=Rubrivirga sp. IMCC43871 TaxID=3391575 RepID=UPI00399019D4
MTTPLFRALVPVLLAALLAAGAAAQSASASLSDTRIRVGETVTYTVTLAGGRGERVGPPLATGALQLVSRQPILDAMTSFNGQVERRVAWAYQATRPGTGRVERFRASVAGVPVSAPAQSVLVVGGAPIAGPSAAPSGGRELFIRAEPSRRTAVVGQQIVVDYVLYFEPQVQPRETSPVGTWDAPGAWREELDIGPAYPRPTTVGGVPYEAVTIRRVALFATRAGTLTLAPMTFSVDLLRTDRSFSNDPFAPFFSPFTRRLEDREVVAPQATVEVHALPDGAPPSFAGAVGQFQLRTTPPAVAVDAGEAVRARIDITGTGNIATLAAPELEVPPGVDVYDPKAEQELFRGGQTLRGVKTFSYTMVPQGGGTLDIPSAPWTYFDPADGQYKTLRTEPLRVEVDGPALLSTPAPGAAPAALLTSADWRRPSGDSGWLWGVLGGGLALPALAGGLFLAARAGRQRLNADTPDKRRRRAHSDATRRLAEARGLAGPAGYAAVERAVRAYLAERHGAPPVASIDDLAAALADAPPELRTQTLAVLAGATQGQFAPGLGAPPAAVLADRAEALLVDLDALS